MLDSTPTMSTERSDFIRDIIDADLASGRHTRVATRFPPEPNGYLHIGHAKSICLNFGLAKQYGGTCNLRYDDTNPTKEDVEYVDSIEADVRWLGFAPTAVLFSADYFPRMFELAQGLIRAGLAYVCDLSDEDIRAYRGTLSEAGKPSPFRDRTVDENLDLFARMKAGEFPDGARVLRAKIDMASANMKMRDPLLYRIRHAHHHRTGDQWCIYPMYDYAHPLEDAFERITHSICTLEFENNRELYDWVIAKTRPTGDDVPPHQYEFARLSLDYTIMSKRKLLHLVEGKHVTGWDDPRMPTIAGMRRRGYRPEAIRAFCELIGVSKANSTVDLAKLEFCVRDDLNHHAPRVMAVLRPLKVEITNWNELGLGGEELLDAPSFPEDVGLPGSRTVPLTRELFIDASDFAQTPAKDYKRLAPGRTVRLRYAYCLTCDDVVTDAAGAVVSLRATLHRETKGGANPTDGRKVWSVIHWVSATHSVPAEVRLYDRLFNVAKPEEGGGDFLEHIDPASLEIIHGARVEPSLVEHPAGSRFQFERTGYFVADEIDSRRDRLVFNRIVNLREGQTGSASVSSAAITMPEKVPHKPNAKAATRPKGTSPAEFRAEARRRDAELQKAYDHALTIGISAGDADLLSGDHATAQLFAAAAALGHPAATARWVINELPRALAGHDLADIAVRPEYLAILVSLVEVGTISNSAGKEVLTELIASGKDPHEIVKAHGFDQTLSSDDLGRLIDDVIANNAAKVAEYRAGKTALLGFFVGQVVRASGGKANPQSVSKPLEEKLR